MPQPPLATSILDAIGNTPLVELRRITSDLPIDGRVLAKCEHMNPGFSKKDRVALEMIRQAGQSGDLKPGQTVVELTSGNNLAGALQLLTDQAKNQTIAILICDILVEIDDNWNTQNQTLHHMAGKDDLLINHEFTDVRLHNRLLFRL